MRFTLEFDCNNAAFGVEDPDAMRDEIGRILSEVARGMQDASIDGKQFVRDANGGVVGHWRITE